MMIWACRVINSDGTEDMEFLDEEPADSFIDGLWDAINEGRVQAFFIRAGNVNGGDSILEYGSIG